MVEKYLEVVTLLAEIAGSFDSNTYDIVMYSCGYLVYKNDELVEIGNEFEEVARWLIDEQKENYMRQREKEILKKREMRQKAEQNNAM